MKAIAALTSLIIAVGPAAVAAPVTYTFTLMEANVGYYIDPEPYGEVIPLYLAGSFDEPGHQAAFEFDIKAEAGGLAGLTYDMALLSSDSFEITGWRTFGETLPAAWNFEGFRRNGTYGFRFASDGVEEWSWHDYVSNPDVLPPAGTPVYSQHYSPPDYWTMITAPGHWECLAEGEACAVGTGPVIVTPLPATAWLLAAAALAALGWTGRRRH